MQRLTKAAFATGAAAVLLLGGAGTMAYWTGQATAGTPAVLDSGTFTVQNGTCGDWTYVNGGAAVDLIVPGDTVTTTCTFVLNATGDHVGIGGATVSAPVWTNSDALTSALGTATVSGIQVTTSSGSVTLQTDSSGMLASPQPVGTNTTVAVAIQVAFPYGDATTISNNLSQNLTASLDTVQVTLIQGNTSSPVAP